MLYEIDKETIDFLCKHKITFNQFAICLLIYKKDTATIIRINEEIGVIGNYLIHKGVNSVGKKLFKTELDDLIDRGFITHVFVDKRDEYSLDNYIVNDKFKEGFLDEEGDMFEELWQAYPKMMYINGIEYPSKTGDYEELKEKYIRLIKNSKRRHKEVLSKLEIHKSLNRYAFMGIEKYIGSRQWENVEDVKVSKLV
jgi:hypothetical protein